MEEVEQRKSNKGRKSIIEKYSMQPIIDDLSNKGYSRRSLLTELRRKYPDVAINLSVLERYLQAKSKKSKIPDDPVESLELIDYRLRRLTNDIKSNLRGNMKSEYLEELGDIRNMIDKSKRIVHNEQLKYFEKRRWILRDFLEDTINKSMDDMPELRKRLDEKVRKWIEGQESVPKYLEDYLE